MPKNSYTFLEKYRDEIFCCMRCGNCRAVCPTFAEDMDESMVARGRLGLAEAVLDGRLSTGKVFRDRISSCIDCKSCVVNCPSGVRVDEIIHAAKAEIARRRPFNRITEIALQKILTSNWALPTILRFFGLLNPLLLEQTSQTGLSCSMLPFGFRGEKRAVPNAPKSFFRTEYPEIIKARGNKSKGRVAFYAGCVINLTYPQVGRSVINVLTRMGMDVVLPKGEVCCGAPLLSLGNERVVKALARKNLSLFNRKDVEAVIVSCGTCGVVLKKEYKRLFPSKEVEEFASKIIDIHEFVTQVVGARFIVPNKSGLINQTPTVLRATYHDPCHLNRGMGIRDKPREILKSLPGVEFREMDEADRCCGFGGVFSMFHYDLSTKIAQKKVANIKDSGADTLVTGCPGCMMHIADGITRAGLPIKVKHTVELLDEATITPP